MQTDCISKQLEFEGFDGGFAPSMGPSACSIGWPLASLMAATRIAWSTV
jgi:hypothetical protein